MKLLPVFCRLRRLKNSTKVFFRRSLPNFEAPADAEIDLSKRSAAELIECGLLAVDYGAIIGGAGSIDIGGGRERIGPGAFKLRRCADFQLPRTVRRSGNREPVRDVLSRRLMSS